MKTVLLAYVFALLGTTAALAVPALKGDVTVNAEIVTVGDLFANAGELSETAIFRAPAPGTTGIVPLAAVETAARAIGLADFDNVGYTRVRVVRASTTVDTTMLNGLINETLQQKGVLPPGVTAEPHYDLTNISFNAERVDRPAILNDLRYTPDGGPFTARFTIAGIDQPVDLTGTLSLMTTAPRLVATTPAGTILAATDFEIAEVPLSTASAGTYADL